jgi:hypothetical protein
MNRVDSLVCFHPAILSPFAFCEQAVFSGKIMDVQKMLIIVNCLNHYNALH